MIMYHNMSTMIVAKKRPYKKYGKKRSGYVTKRQMYKAIHSNIENKIYSRPVDPDLESITAGAWASANMMLVPQGTTNITRIGNTITLRNMEVNGVISNGDHHFTINHPSATLRIVIALWASGADTNPLQNSAWPFDTPLRRTQCPQGLLKKYYDKYIPINCITNDLVNIGQFIPSIRKFKYYKQFKKGLKIDFGANTSTAFPDKRLIISVCHDAATGSGLPGFVKGYWAVSYEDA